MNVYYDVIVRRYGTEAERDADPDHAALGRYRATAMNMALRQPEWAAHVIAGGVPPSLIAKAESAMAGDAP